MSELFGSFHVTPSPTAMREANDLFPRYRDYQRARKHALKLAFWPAESAELSGKAIDLDWDTITGMEGPKACELRIDDVIGGFNNIRIIFYAFSKDIILPGDILPRLFTIGVMQKKTQKFSKANLDTFKARVAIIRRRYYADYI